MRPEAATGQRARTGRREVGGLGKQGVSDRGRTKRVEQNGHRESEQHGGERRTCADDAENALAESVPLRRELQQDAVGGFRMHKDLRSSFSDQLCAGVLHGG